MAKRLIISVLSTLLLMACASQSVPTPDNSSPLVEREGFSVQDYRLGAGDQIRVTVFGEENLSGRFAVDGSGLVSLPLVGEVEAMGLTVREFQSNVDAALRNGYLKDPKVSAEIIEYRPFYILGEVKRPGTYPYQSGLTVLNAVATAEGFTYRANQRAVFIRRNGEAKEQRYPLTSTTPVQPGDTIRVSERFF